MFEFICFGNICFENNVVRCFENRLAKKHPDIFFVDCDTDDNETTAEEYFSFLIVSKSNFTFSMFVFSRMDHHNVRSVCCNLLSTGMKLRPCRISNSSPRCRSTQT